MQRERPGAQGVVRAAAAALAIVMGLGACEGDNLFRNAPPVTDEAPRVTQLLAPSTAVYGDSVPVTIRARAGRGLAEVQVRYRGALNTDQNIGFAPPGADSATVHTGVRVIQGADSLLVITAVARDFANRTSSPVSTTVVMRAIASPASGARE